MGVFAKKGDAEEPGGAGGGPGLHLDLDERFCVICRRAVLPWQTQCPDDGGEVAALGDLPSSIPPPPAHLLDDEADAD
jgi:hypothetical protein